MQSVDSASSSESDSTEEEERLRRLFSSCDRDGDGYIDSQDLLHMCRLLNMEDAVDEIIQHLGIVRDGGDGQVRGHISFEDFMRCRLNLGSEIEHERLVLDSSFVHRGMYPVAVDSVSGDIPLQTPDNSDISQGFAGTSSQDYDSGAHDMCSCSGPPVSLYKLLEGQNSDMLHMYMLAVESRNCVDILQAADALHLAAMSSLKGEVIELSGRLQRLHAEKDILDKQFAKLHVEKLRMQREFEERQEQQAFHYEDRITELQSVIAELRKKIDLRHINMILEEDEESDGVASNQSAEDGSVNENTNNYSNNGSVVDMPTDIEMSKVVADLEYVIASSCGLGDDADVNADENVARSSTAVNKVNTDRTTQEAVKSSVSYCIESHVSKLKSENSALVDKITRQDAEINRLQIQLSTVTEERDSLKAKVMEFQKRPQDMPLASPTVKSTSSVAPVCSPTQLSDNQPSSPLSAPVSKVAELKKLKTGRQERHVLGAELSSLGVSNVKVAEHLAQGLQECSRVQEIIQCSGMSGIEGTSNIVHEFEIELEQLQSRLDHLKAQNDVLSLTLTESKAHCNHLTILLGKYESSITAHQMSTSYADQALSAYQVLVGLLDTELALLTSKCQVLGVCGYDRSTDTSILQMAVDARHAAEVTAKQLLCQADGCSVGHNLPSTAGSPWEDLSSSRTASSVSSIVSTDDVSWSKADESRLRQQLVRLRDDRSVVKLTIVDLESVHLDPFTCEPRQDACEAQKLDLENAVLMQELMAIKEEKAELKAVNHRLMKEKARLQSTVQDQRNSSDEREDSTHSQAGVTASAISCISLDLEQALRREGRLKDKVQELTKKLEKLREHEKTSEMRHQQSVGFVNELKKANSALVSAFEKAKKKYVVKVKKMETQMELMTERHESQLLLLRQKLSSAEEQLRRYLPSSSPTSL